MHFKAAESFSNTDLAQTTLSFSQDKGTYAQFNHYKSRYMWHIGKFRFSGELVSFKELGQLDLIKVL